MLSSAANRCAHRLSDYLWPATGRHVSFPQFLMLALLLTLLSGCDRVIREPLRVSPQLTSSMRELGLGVKAKVPKDFEKAETYHGFQARNNAGSISVNTDPPSLNYFREKYESEAFQGKRYKLLELRPVTYRGNENALFVAFHDTKNKTLSYKLCVETKEVTYQISSFCFADEAGKYAKRLRDAVLGAHIGMYTPDVPPFVIGNSTDDYVEFVPNPEAGGGARQGESWIRIFTVPSELNLGESTNNQHRFLRREAAKLRDGQDDKALNPVAELLESGQYVSAHTSHRDSLYYLALALSGNHLLSQFAISKAESRAQLEETKDYIRSRFIRTRVVVN